MEQSALFFDLDGTILSEMTHEIPGSAIEALTKARENGHLLFINTGRTWCAVPEVVKTAPFDGCLCGCGTYLVYHGEVLFESLLDREWGAKILRKMQECNIDGLCEAAQDLYFSGHKSRFEELEHRKELCMLAGFGRTSFLEDGNFTFSKIFIHTDAMSDTREFFDFVSEDLEAIDRENGRYEVTLKWYSKATACDYILDYFQIPKERCYVFGDSSNDLSMFQYAPHGIAMGKHSPVLAPYTEFVTKTVEEDGIAHALKHYGFI